MRIKAQVFFFVKHRVAKVDEGALCPKWLRVLRWFLYPWRAFCSWAALCIYDPASETYNIGGMRMSEEFLENVLPDLYVEYQKRGSILE